MFAHVEISGEKQMLTYWTSCYYYCSDYTVICFYITPFRSQCGII